jgi:hypothetical protein
MTAMQRSIMYQRAMASQNSGVSSSVPTQCPVVWYGGPCSSFAAIGK